MTILGRALQNFLLTMKTRFCRLDRSTISAQSPILLTTKDNHRDDIPKASFPRGYQPLYPARNGIRPRRGSLPSLYREPSQPISAYLSAFKIPVCKLAGRSNSRGARSTFGRSTRVRRVMLLHGVNKFLLLMKPAVRRNFVLAVRASHISFRAALCAICLASTSANTRHASNLSTVRMGNQLSLQTAGCNSM